MFCSQQDLMGENVFCESLAGEEIGRMKSWGNHPLSKAEHQLSSPTMMNDLPQTFMEPLLFKTACSRGTQARMSTEYLSHVQDGKGVTTTCRDRLTGKEVTIRSKYLLGGDGGNSKVAELREAALRRADGRRRLDEHHLQGRPVQICRPPSLGALLGGAAWRRCRRHRHGPGADGPALERMADRLGLRHQRPRPVVDNAFATKVVRELVGDQSLSRRSPRCRPGPSTTCTPPTCRRTGCSSWVTRRTGIRPPTGLAPTRRSRTLQPRLEAGRGSQGAGRCEPSGQLQPGTRTGGQADRDPGQPVDRRIRPDLRGSGMTESTPIPR
jgi:hypothetical protein